MTGTNSPSTAAEQPINWHRVILASGLLVIGFGLPLYRLTNFAVGHELYSHLVLIPLVSAYLLWIDRHRFVPIGTRVSPGWTALFLIAGTVLLTGYFLASNASAPVPLQDLLALAVYALVLLLAGLCCWFLNRETLRVFAFPLVFLFFLAPFPARVEAALESLLQHGSAPAAHFLLSLIGTPVMRDGTFFQLPGFHMQVAPECSGIHSTLALFITSIVAGRVLLRTTWGRVVLTVAVLPLALLRNGLRVATIGELCVRLGPEMINSYIHRQGGPIFFAISLVPFSFLLILLLKMERKKKITAVSAA